MRLPKFVLHKDERELKVLRIGEMEVRIEDGKVTIDGQEIAPGEGGKKVIVKRVDEGETGDGSDARIIMPPMPPMPPMTGPLGGRLDGPLLKSKGVTTSLGVKEFDGVKAEGKSTVHTIPAGEIGNRNPIMVTSESWHSPELKVTVYSRQSDPRYGETIYRLTNIRRAEPAPELFKVPEEYAGGGKRARGWRRP